MVIFARSLVRFAWTKRCLHYDSEFMVSSANGFLPRHDPLERLPDQLAPLEELLQQMPLYHNRQNDKGLLYHEKLGEATSSIPLYDLSKYSSDTKLLSALFRDYTFWASAYLLEPCDIMYRSSGGSDYGLGRSVLPQNIAVPLVQVAQMIGAKPFMEYALSYALSNWRRIDKAAPVKFDNLSLIRSFSGLPSESGFILVHVAMVAKTPKLVKATFSVLQAVQERNREDFDASMEEFGSVLQDINAVMEEMWARSKPADYQKFRTFIMGVKNQPMFPNGVIYEGVSPHPMSFRGESGANDSIIPTADNLLELYDRMPNNPLTDILKDFREYRPIGHQIFLKYVYERAKQAGVRSFALANSKSALKYIQALDQVRDFRWRHWNFTKEYILKHTRHPVATGGSPIVSWLPNQLSVVLQAITEAASHIKPKDLTLEERMQFARLRELSAAQHRILKAEVSKLRQENPGQDTYILNT